MGELLMCDVWADRRSAIADESDHRSTIADYIADLPSPIADVLARLLLSDTLGVPHLWEPNGVHNRNSGLPGPENVRFQGDPGILWTRDV